MTLTCCRARMSSSFPVPGIGPSSNVKATHLARAQSTGGGFGVGVGVGAGFGAGTATGADGSVPAGASVLSHPNDASTATAAADLWIAADQRRPVTEPPM
ncbi:hypothetical protein Acsp04_45430 [Actinomadura sp. NBRC 104425]|nr:hypothetical protein Acsp04_45430 [Actinomadura sp. NBRC 104425]